MKYLLLPLFAISILISTTVKAQDFEIPEKYKLVAVEDYAPYIPLIKQTCDWLIKTPLTENTEFRAKANAFLLKWIEGAPYTFIMLNNKVFAIINSDADYAYMPFMLANYIAGMVQENVGIPKKEVDQIKAQKAGILAILTSYESVKEQSPNKGIEKIYKIYKKGKLDSWIASNVTVIDL